MRPPLTRQGQVGLWLSLLLGALFLLCAGAVWGAELHWQQRDGEAPIVRWHVSRFGIAAPVETIEAASIPTGIPVTPGPWFPTPGPGTPTPITHDYTAPVSQAGGSLLTLSAEDSRGLRSLESNLIQLATATMTPAATHTPSQTRTHSPTRTPTLARPLAPQLL